MLRKYRFILTLSLWVVAFSGYAQKSSNNSHELRLASALGSNMVLQQNEPITIWGEARPGTKILAQLDDEKSNTTADQQGNWRVTFKARKASFEPISLKVNDLNLQNILIGEVWLCSGQSNMNFKLKDIDTYDSIIDCTANNKLRILQHTNIRIVAKNGYSDEELARCNTQNFFDAEWVVSEKETVGEASAVAWLFGHGLQHKLDVPVGIIQVALGGSALNNWIPPGALQANPSTKSLFATDWLENEQVKLAHRERARDAFQNVLTPGKPYMAGQFPYRWLCEPGFLFEAGIAPLQHLPFRGVLWYQGESDTDNAEMVEAAKDLFPLMVNEWRAYFNRGDFPFIYVQLPGFKNELWPEFREMQKQAQQTLANTAMVVSLDLGDPKNIHPKDKQRVGERAVHNALKYVYGFNDLSGSPKPENWVQDKDEITLRFSECGDGLQSATDTIFGFEVAGKNGDFKTAKACIASENTLRILSPVKEVQWLRYGWMPFPNPPLTLYNSELLPLGPFRINLNNQF
ncbi:sialate O-acetylesterase [Mangrovibacterium sp.]|uniref:sialate O-acetylesterase n=1 Tax=Mangrovibacterium sp. TaxID=1961364 RepID=UPI0035618CEB